jgi:gas vesicle protein
MPPQDKKLDKLNQLFDMISEEYATPDDLIRMSDALLGLISEEKKRIARLLADTETKLSEITSTNEAELRAKLDDIAIKESNLKDLIAQLSTQTRETFKEVRGEVTQSITQVKSALQAELARVEGLIPDLPPSFDSSDLQNALEGHQEAIDAISALIVGENLRNALEALPEGDKLAIDAVEGLREALERPTATGSSTGAIIARFLGQIGDVSVTGATDGQVLAYNATTGLWEAATPSSGSGILRSVIVTSGNTTMGAAAATDYIYLVAGAHTMTLPTAVGNTNRYTVKNNHSVDVTINTTSSQTIDGTTTLTIASEDSIDLISNGSNWNII